MFSCFGSRRPGAARRAEKKKGESLPTKESAQQQALEKHRGHGVQADIQTKGQMEGAVLVHSQGEALCTGASFFISGNSFPLICIHSPQGICLEEYARWCTALAESNIFFQSLLLAFFNTKSIPEPLPGPVELEAPTLSRNGHQGALANSTSIPSALRLQYMLHKLRPEAGASSPTVPALLIKHLPSASGAVSKKSSAHSDAEPVPKLAVYAPQPYKMPVPFPVPPQQSQLNDETSSPQGSPSWEFGFQEPKQVNCITQLSTTQHHIERQQLMQSEMPVLLTLLSQDGIVLEQNNNSMLYHGNVVGDKAWDLKSEEERLLDDSEFPSGIIKSLFALVSDLLCDVMEFFLDPSIGPWKSIVQVPAKAAHLNRSHASVTGQLRPEVAPDITCLDSAAGDPVPLMETPPDQTSSAQDLLSPPKASIPQGASQGNLPTPPASMPNPPTQDPPHLSKQVVPVPFIPSGCNFQPSERHAKQSNAATGPASRISQNSRLASQIAAKMANFSLESGSGEWHQAWVEGQTSACLSLLDSHNVLPKAPVDSTPPKDASSHNRLLLSSMDQPILPVLQGPLATSSCIDKYALYRDLRSPQVRSNRTRSESKAEAHIFGSYDTIECSTPLRRAAGGGDDTCTLSGTRAASSPVTDGTVTLARRGTAGGLRRATSLNVPLTPAAHQKNRVRTNLIESLQRVSGLTGEQAQARAASLEEHIDQSLLLRAPSPAPCENKASVGSLTSLVPCEMKTTLANPAPCESQTMLAIPAPCESKTSVGILANEANEPADDLGGREQNGPWSERRSTEYCSRPGSEAVPHNHLEHLESEEEPYTRSRCSIHGRGRISRHTARSSISYARSSAGVGGTEPPIDLPLVYHEVELKCVPDPVTEQPAFLLIQRDASEQMMLENLLSELTEDQLAMLSQIFPRHIIQALSTDGAVTLDNIADLTCSHSDVTILFLDIVSFTATCGKASVTPESVIAFLNYLFGQFDRLVNKYQVQKIDTIGDAYLVASGILAPDADGFWALDREHDGRKGAGRMVALAVDMMRAGLEVSMPDGSPVRLRIGVHTGPCVSGLVGLDVPKWSVFGDTVNTTARLEQTSPPSCIQLSEASLHLLPAVDIGLVPSGGVDMKGKGRMETWLWHPPPTWASRDPSWGLPPLPHEIEALRQMCSPSSSPSKAFLELSCERLQALQDCDNSNPMLYLQRPSPSLLSRHSSRGSEGEPQQDGQVSNVAPPATLGSLRADGSHPHQDGSETERASRSAYSDGAHVPVQDTDDALQMLKPYHYHLGASKSFPMPRTNRKGDSAGRHISSLSTSSGLQGPKLFRSLSLVTPLFTQSSPMLQNRKSSTTRGSDCAAPGVHPLNSSAKRSNVRVHFSEPPAFSVFHTPIPRTGQQQAAFREYSKSFPRATAIALHTSSPKLHCAPSVPVASDEASCQHGQMLARPDASHMLDLPLMGDSSKPKAVALAANCTEERSADELALVARSTETRSAEELALARKSAAGRAAGSSACRRNNSGLLLPWPPTPGLNTPEDPAADEVPSQLGAKAEQHASSKVHEQAGTGGEQQASNKVLEQPGAGGEQHASSEVPEQSGARPEQHASSKMLEQSGVRAEQHASSKVLEQPGARAEQHASSEVLSQLGAGAEQHGCSQAPLQEGAGAEQHASSKVPEEPGSHAEQCQSGGTLSKPGARAEQHASSKVPEQQGSHAKRCQSGGALLQRGSKGEQCANSKVPEQPGARAEQHTSSEVPEVPGSHAKRCQSGGALLQRGAKATWQATLPPQKSASFDQVNNQGVRAALPAFGIIKASNSLARAQAHLVAAQHSAHISNHNGHAAHDRNSGVTQPEESGRQPNAHGRCSGALGRRSRDTHQENGRHARAGLAGS